MVKLLKWMIICLLVLFAVSVFLIYLVLDESTRSPVSFSTRRDHLLCILVPYRNRSKELQQMVPHLNQFLSNQSVAHRFIILNQTDNLRFNRASLINIGWLEADRLACDYMCMHDVDILPLNPDLDYRFPGNGIVKHISSGEYHPIQRYDYKKFIGGVLMLTMEDFHKVNGMSNLYWGWGLEDDEFYLRLRKRDYAKSKMQKQMSRRRDRKTGLRSVQYNITSRSFLRFNSINASVLHIDLKCDLELTPYCIQHQKF